MVLMAMKPTLPTSVTISKSIKQTPLALTVTTQHLTEVTQPTPSNELDQSLPLTPVNFTSKVHVPLTMQQLTQATLTVGKDHLPLPSFKLKMIEDSLKKTGHKLTDLPPWSALWTDKIHLCVMFNLNNLRPKKDVDIILASYYYPFFRNITFIYDNIWERPDYLPEFVNYMGCKSSLGWYQHKCIRLCMQQGTEETEGYMYVADDLFVNLIKMAELPKTKVWFDTMLVRKFSWLVGPGAKAYDWWAWDPPVDISRKFKKIFDIMPVKWRDHLKKTAGWPDQFKARGYSDIIYIPAALRANLTESIDWIVKSMDLFHEVATCLAVNIAVPDENTVIEMENGYLWGSNRTIPKREKLANTNYFVHPVKLGVDVTRKLWIKLMENQLSILLNM